MDNYRAMLGMIQQAFPVNYSDPTASELSDRIKLYETARRIRHADYEKDRSKA